ncbi:hypothetical protein [Acidovorax sp. NCPPB 4044]|uniref:hypothetical protein n=1 Tax=Acidovorax sp. NCPPB 4044 TaxID=2940490 RepID=UPI0023020EBD|nr:hypothetical protein [Acidovorax sp. NCPPB 4044]MDA8521772.1 hypothetical protein [Acidovorax sp. NCPPB 4044]
MKKRTRVPLFAAWMAGASLPLTGVWIRHPDWFPAAPPALAHRLAQIHGAENAEQVADLEMLPGLALGIPVEALASPALCRTAHLLAPKKKPEMASHRHTSRR